MTVLDDTGSPPLAREVATELLRRGWHPLPLPPRAKSQPPTGYTGYTGRYTTAADIARWAWDGNIAIRLPPDVIGIDTDVYHGGEEGLAELTARYGQLPLAVWSTSREDGSGIALFRVPAGTTLATDPAQGVDMIQAHHRYMVVWPSIHPEGRLYQWVDEASGELLDAPPEPDELPELPWAWIEGLRVVKDGAAASATPDEARAFISRHTTTRRPAALRAILAKLDDYTGARHDNLVTSACWAMREAAAGRFSAQAAVDGLHTWWRRVMDDPGRRDGGEFGAAILWAVAQAEADVERIATIRADDDAYDAQRGTAVTSGRPEHVCPRCGSVNTRVVGA